MAPVGLVKFLKIYWVKAIYMIIVTARICYVEEADDGTHTLGIVKSPITGVVPFYTKPTRVFRDAIRCRN